MYEFCSDMLRLPGPPGPFADLSAVGFHVRVRVRADELVYMCMYVLCVCGRLASTCARQCA